MNNASKIKINDNIIMITWLTELLNDCLIIFNLTVRSDCPTFSE